MTYWLVESRLVTECSSDTSAAVVDKVPIGYNGTPQIHPQNCPFPFDDHHRNLIHPFLDQPPLTTTNGIRIQSAVLPQYTLQTDRQTNGISESSVTWALSLTMLIEVAEKFELEVKNRFDTIAVLQEEETPDELWQATKTVLLDTAKEIVGCKKTLREKHGYLMERFP